MIHCHNLSQELHFQELWFFTAHRTRTQPSVNWCRMLRRNPSRPNPGVDADGPVTKYPPYKCWIGIPIGSMYGIYANI